MSKPIMDSHEYVAKKGLRCPYCGSDDIHTGDLDHVGTVIYQNVNCRNCPEDWTDEFTLTGYCPVE